jgi:hypothetical protein
LGFPTGRSSTRHQVPNWAASTANKHFLALLPGRNSISARGVYRFQSSTFVIVLLTFFNLFLFAYFYQKYKKIVPL